MVASFDPFIIRGWLKMPLELVTDRIAPLGDVAPHLEGALGEQFFKGSIKAIGLPTNAIRLSELDIRLTRLPPNYGVVAQSAHLPTVLGCPSARLSVFSRSSLACDGNCSPGYYGSDVPSWSSAKELRSRTPRQRRDTRINPKHSGTSPCTHSRCSRFLASDASECY